MFRPQWLYNPDSREQSFLYSFTSVNVPSFAGNLAAGAWVNNIPLRLDADAGFSWRALSVWGAGTLSLRFRDPWGNYLSDDANPTLAELAYEGYSAAVTAPALFVPRDPSIECPPRAVLWVDILNPGVTQSLATLEIAFLGVKRYEH